MSNEYLYDDFFISEDDPGVEMQVPINGRVVPITFRRGLTVEETEKVRAAAIKKRLRPDGQMELVDVNETAYQLHVVALAVKSWPFVKRAEDGVVTPVPVTLETVKRLGGDALNALFNAYQLVLARQQEALAPFEPPSDVA